MHIDIILKFYTKQIVQFEIFFIDHILIYLSNKIPYSISKSFPKTVILSLIFSISIKEIKTSARTCINWNSFKS